MRTLPRRAATVSVGRFRARLRLALSRPLRGKHRPDNLRPAALAYRPYLPDYRSAVVQPSLQLSCPYSASPYSRSTSSLIASMRRMSPTPESSSDTPRISRGVNRSITRLAKSRQSCSE